MHVTVLIPVYNREGFIGDAIDSVIAQNYPDWDVLVVDDGSTDRTVEVVKSRMSDDRITLIQTKHGGCAAANAKGIEHACGPVITRLDSDDKLMPDSLSSVMSSFENNPRLGYVWTNWIDSTDQKGTGDYLPNDKNFLGALISGWWKANCQHFFRKDLYLQSEGLDTSIEYAVDFQLALLIGRTGCDTLHIPKVTYWVRVHPHRITSEHGSEQYEDWRLLRRKFCEGNPSLQALYIIESEIEREMLKKERDALRSQLTSAEKEMDSLRGELASIRKSFGYKLMRLYGPIIDVTLPDNTKRGALKRRVLGVLRGST